MIPETAYHYRIRAYNSAASAGVWASSSQTFNTQATTLPVVSNGSLLNATGTAVTFKAGITALGIGKVDQGAAAFTANRYPNLMLWFDANEVGSMDKGLSMSDPAQPPSNNDNIGFWADKSGNEHHGSPYGGQNNRKPKYLSAGMNSKPTVQFDGGDNLFLNNSADAASQWTTATPQLNVPDRCQCCTAPSLVWASHTTTITQHEITSRSMPAAATRKKSTTHRSAQSPQRPLHPRRSHPPLDDFSFLFCSSSGRRALNK